MRKIFCAVLAAPALMSGRLLACDLCSVYAATQAHGEGGKGFIAGFAEQYTEFGTLQDEGHVIANDGQYIHSSISQVFAGYNFCKSFGVQVNLPVIYRAYGDNTMHDSVSGIGDLSVIGNVVVWQKLAEEYTFNGSLLGGVKFPTGDSSKLNTPDTALPEGIGGHDLALGSGSFDGVIGANVFARWKRMFATGGVQYAIRTEGDFGHQYANDLTWSGGPGAYLALEDNYSLSVQAIVSGETKGKDNFNGVLDEDSAETLVALGPQINFTRGSNVSVQLGADLPVSIYNSGTQVVPDYRVRGSILFRF